MFSRSRGPCELSVHTSHALSRGHRKNVEKKVDEARFNSGDLSGGVWLLKNNSVNWCLYLCSGNSTALSHTSVLVL